MGREIEHKYLVHPEFEPTVGGTLYRQGYLSASKESAVRVRVFDERGFLTIKGETIGIARSEYEYEIPYADAVAILDRLCLRPLIEKTRYKQPWAGRIWDVDVFHGDNEGLLVAEIEVESETEDFAKPPWLGEEVSHDPRYFNSNLGKAPYHTWRA